MHILLLEDDITLAETLIELLQSENFEVTWVQHGEAALDATYKKSFDFFLFDINVPLLSGFETLKVLRDFGNKTPTIFLTALSDISSLTKGFEVGADDYIKKPFDFDELVVRIHALIRKSFSTQSDDVVVDNLTFNINSSELKKEDMLINLTAYEMKLCRLFFMNIGHTITKENLLEVISSDGESSSGTLRVYINKLRKHGLNIENIKGVGYKFG